MEIKKLTGLNAKDYEHPFDKKALNALQATPGLGILMKKLSQYGIEKILKIHYTGSNLKLNPKTYPEIYNILKEVCDILCVSQIPDMYFSARASIDVTAAGVENPILIMTAGCVNLLTPEEMMFMIGHEVGHIKSQHLLYQQLVTIIPFLADIIGTATLGIGKIIAKGVQLPLVRWQRMSEFTADRAGLLACQNINIVTKALIKVAGAPRKYFDAINVEDFVKQAEEFQGYDFDTLDKIAKIVCAIWQNEPWTVMRAAELFKWLKTGEYQVILNKYPQEQEKEPPVDTAGRVFCPYCGFKLEGSDICPGCKRTLEW